MHAGRIEEASAVSSRIGIAIVKANRRELNDVNSSLGTKALWQRVNKIIKKPNESESGSKVTSEELNSHYANISTDPSYVPPGKRLTAHLNVPLVTEMRFHDNSSTDISSTTLRLQTFRLQTFRLLLYTSVQDSYTSTFCFSK